MICAVKPVNGMALAELAIRIRDLNALEADRAAPAFERQAAFGGVVGAVFRSDCRVEHYEDATAEKLVHECNDALRDADHACAMRRSRIAMCVERVLEILCDGKILGRIERLRRRLALKRNGRHDFALHVMFPLAGSFAGLPTLYGVIVRRRTAMGRMTGSRLFIYGMSREILKWDRNRRNMLNRDDMLNIEIHDAGRWNWPISGSRQLVNESGWSARWWSATARFSQPDTTTATADRMRNAWFRLCRRAWCRHAWSHGHRHSRTLRRHVWIAAGMHRSNSFARHNARRGRFDRSESHRGRQRTSHS